MPSPRTQAARKFVAAADNLAGFQLHPAGHSLAVEMRGKLFTFALWEGAVRQHGAAHGVRYRQGQWLADGETLVAVSDESGEERVVVVRDGEATTMPWDIGRVLTMCAAPVGKRIALANHRHEVMIADLESNAFSVVDRSDAGRSEDLAWSPDGAVARLHALDQSAALRDQAPRRRDEPVHAGHPARFPRLLPGVRSRGQVPVLPVGAHLRPGVRRRAVRAVVPARRAART